ncbi:hypothetical protein WIX39_026130 [Variovorax sp. AB1(2024)]|uniref:hypothetical protein n=1 Tax=Variovorax sp. AB1(2024) TaxID=3132214 RepID=UPI0030A4122A
MNHARIEDGRVVGIFLPQFYTEGPNAGQEIPLSDLYHPDFVATLVECPEDTMDGDIYDGETFSHPAIHIPTHAELVAQAKADTRIQRQPIITVLDGLQATCLTKGETARALALEVAKQGLRDIMNTDLSACVTYEDMRQAVKAAYLGLAMALPVDLRKAFSDAIK